VIKYEHLLGIPFEHGVDDCYEIVRRFYKDNFDIELTAYARPDDWWNNGLNLYLDNFRAEGFETVDIPIHQARPADVFLVCVRTSIPCHSGIYLGQGKILHHFIGRRSEVVTASGLWRNGLSCIVRHKDVPDLSRTTRPTLDLMDYLPPHKRRQLEQARAAYEAQ